MFLGYKFHVKCRNLQSCDLYLLKRPFRKFFSIDGVQITVGIAAVLESSPN